MEGGEGSPLLELPNVGEAAYLINYWHDAGTVEQGGMGITPLSWQEIRAWRQENNMVLDSFEIGIIRRLSQEYVGEYHANSSEKSRPPPYELETMEDFDRTAMASKVGNLLRAFVAEKKSPRYIVEDN